MAWTPTLPADLEKLKDSPAIFRAMWAAIATGTDPALLITNDKVSPTAGIVDTKLAQIATASKVSGTALTGLASIPSGAGVIPVANIPDLAASKITTGQLAIARGGTNLSSAGGSANRVLLTADGSTFAMGQVALTSMVTGTLPTANGGTGSTANANAANGVVVLDASSKLPAVDGSQLTGIVAGDASISTTKLKTTTGEVTVYNKRENALLPGGEYGFYPQIKKHASYNFASTINIFDYQAGEWSTTTYSTRIGVTAIDGRYAYIKQRYVTASGEDLWIFLLINKATKDIVSAYQAPDHPAYGNGGDFEKSPHPFGCYDENTEEIVLVDKQTCLAIKQESKASGKSILTLINEDYKADMNSNKKYEPLHSGRYIKENKDGYEAQVREMVKTIPSYIKVRGLVRK